LTWIIAITLFPQPVVVLENGRQTAHHSVLGAALHGKCLGQIHSADEKHSPRAWPVRRGIEPGNLAQAL
jgi:hypothetical protein